MCDEASVVEMLSALPSQRVGGRESFVERRERETEKGAGETEREGNATKRGLEDGREKGELETRFASCRHLEAISYRFTRTPTKVSVHLHLESSFEIARCTYCNACYEYRARAGFMTHTTRSHATERRETLKPLSQPFR